MNDTIDKSNDDNQTIKALTSMMTQMLDMQKQERTETEATKAKYKFWMWFVAVFVGLNTFTDIGQFFY